ncbi:MAG: DUF2062 domain-containing protein [Rhodospirillaceae bacterium]
MFRRRVPLSFIHRTREYFWPRAGFRRALTYLWHRLARMPGSHSAIAAGFASGVAVSFLPLNGLHFLLAALLAWMVRGNILASALGTFVGNPWTFPPMWLASYWLGRLMLGEGADHGAQALEFSAVFHALWHGIRHLDMPHLVENVWPVWWPMFVGGIPLAVLSWFAFYLPIRRAMVGYHHVRGLRRLEKLAARARQQQAVEEQAAAVKEREQ